MAAPWIIKSLDVFKHRELGLCLRVKAAPIKQLTFERSKKAFGHRIVIRIADRTDRWHHAHLSTTLAESETRVLAAVIGMMDHVLGPPLCERHVDGSEHQLGLQMIVHRPTDDLARTRVQYDCQVQESRPGRDIRDIGHPESIKLADAKVSIHQIRRHIRMDIRHRGTHETPTPHPAQPRRTHEPRDTLAPDVDVVLVSEFGMNTRSPIASARGGVMRVHIRRQRDILQRPPRRRALQPNIESAHRDCEQPAHRPYRIGGLVRFHKSEERFVFGAVSCANQAAAFDKISRSILSWRFSRRSFASSSRSALVKPPSPRPASRSACLTQPRIDHTEQPNSLLSCTGCRPARTSSTICCRNSGVYRFAIFDLAIVDSSSVKIEESTETGQLQSIAPPIDYITLRNECLLATGAR